MGFRVDSKFKNLEVLFTPVFLPFYDVQGKVVIIIDIFRATTAVCAALSNEVMEIIPVSTVEEALSFKGGKFILASERQGEKPKGFDLGNSPQGFLDPSLKGKSIILSTTNGTNAILGASGAEYILLGSFLNISALAEKIKLLNLPVILLCAGWINRFSMEDAVFAGALTDKLKDNFNYEHDDSAACALYLYDLAKSNLKEFLLKSSHYNRLKHLNLEEDINYSLQSDITNVIPYFDGNSLRKFDV